MGRLGREGPIWHSIEARRGSEKSRSPVPDGVSWRIGLVLFAAIINLRDRDTGQRPESHTDQGDVRVLGSFDWQVAQVWDPKSILGATCHAKGARGEVDFPKYSWVTCCRNHAEDAKLPHISLIDA